MKKETRKNFHLEVGLRITVIKNYKFRVYPKTYRIVYNLNSTKKANENKTFLSVKHI